MRIISIFIIAICFIESAMSQITAPIPYDLSIADYSFKNWDSALSVNSPGTYPPNMIFHQTDKLDPELLDEMNSDWTCSYNYTSRSRIQGLGNDGFAFYNTGQTQDNINCPGAGFVGEAVLGIKTLNLKNIIVSWVGGFVSVSGKSNRQYNIRLQYRIGNSGQFYDILDSNGLPAEYNFNGYLNSSSVKPDSQLFITKLPSDADSRHLVQLRWKYYYVNKSDASGSRPMMRVDDINIKSGDVSGVKIYNYNNDIKLLCPEMIEAKVPFEFEILSDRFTAININLYNLFGVKVDEIFKGFVQEGSNKFQIKIKDSNYNSGIYFLRINSTHESLIKKIIIVK